MNFTKKTLCTLIVAGLSSLLFAQTKDLKKIVNAKYYDELVKNGVVTIIHKEGDDNLVLVPTSDFTDQIKGNRVEKTEKNYPFVYESVYYMKKSELLKASGSKNSTLDINDISKVLRSVSKMQGMEYYSTTKKKNLVLYEKAYTTDGENSDKKIPDFTDGSADGLVAYCLQDDNSFGVNHYRLNYYQKQDSMLAVFNLTDIMGLGPFKAIYPGKLIINIEVEEFDDAIMLYLCTDLDSVRFPGIKAQIEDSMTSRMDAIYKWFLKQF